MTRKFNFIWFKNYTKLFKDERTLNSLKITLLYTLITVVILLLVAFCIALIMNRKIRFKTAFRAVYFFPAVLSLVVVGMIFYNLYEKAFPLLGQFAGIEFLSKNLISSPDTALMAIIIANIWQGISIPLVIFIAGLQSIPDEIDEAASIDGATGFKRLWYITIPYMIPTIQIVIVLLMRSGITTFDYVQVITNGGPGYATETVPIMIYANAFAKMKFSYAITQSVMLFALMVILSYVQIKVISKKDVVKL
jgi:raffinose/stachyose/melibiose transport system permease protein